LTILNSDNTITAFSKADITGVQAFTPIEVSLFQDEKLNSLGVINNILYSITDQLRLNYSSENKSMDAWKSTTMTSGVISLGFYPQAQVGDMLGVTYETDVNGQINNNYIGEFAVFDDMGTLKVDVGQDITANATIGLNYTTRIRSMPLFSSASGSFKLRKVSNAWLLASYTIALRRKSAKLNGYVTNRCSTRL